MPAASLLTLLDDIASTLDDVAAMTKIASKKTAGVLGDDLALNAEQVSGVDAHRELPIVFSVAKGSAVNKVILVPVAVILSQLAPFLVMPLLMIGGLYLCFEGFEKVFEKALHFFRIKILKKPEIQSAKVKIVESESEKIKGAIRTDFVLSAEIIVISLGTVANESWKTQLAVLSAISVVMTFGVYGFVAMIVKIDDLGFYLRKKSPKFYQRLGQQIISFAPQLMRFLGVAGTLAMFLVGGGIIVHGLPFLHHWQSELSFAGAESITNLFVGVIAGGMTDVIKQISLGIWVKLSPEN